MPIKTQMRLSQITGSLGSGLGQINDAVSPAPVPNATDLSGVLSHMAGAIKRLHGEAAFSENAIGTIKMVDNQASGFVFQEASNTYLQFVTTNSSEEIRIPSDTIKLRFGAGQDMSILHDGTDSVVSNATGHLVLDNTVADKDVIARLGTDNADTSFVVQNNSGAAKFEVDAAGAASFSGDVVITGNLDINGTTTTVDVDNLSVEDELIVLNRSNSGSPTNDIGLVFQRGNGSATNQANKAIIWDESEDQFALIASNTEDGTTTGNVTVGGYEQLKVGSLDVNDGNITNVGNIALDSISADGTKIDITLTDNDGDALEIKEAGNLYMAFDTTNSAEMIHVYKGLDFATAGENALTIPDNESDALTIKEGGNFYMKFDSTNSGEQVEMHKLLDVGASMNFSVAGENALSIPDNQADALTIKEDTNFYMKFVTTNGSEAVSVHKGLQAQASLSVSNGSTSAGFIEFLEDSDNGSNAVKLQGPASTADITLTLPSSVGSAGQVLQSDGSGNLSFVDQSAGAVTAKKFWQILTGSVAKGDFVGTTNNVNWSTYGGGSDKQIDLSGIGEADEAKVVDVYVNGQLMLSGSEADRASGAVDYHLLNQAGVDRANMDLKFAFQLESDDIIAVVARA